MEEHRLDKPGVAGSSPAFPTRDNFTGCGLVWLRRRSGGPKSGSPNLPIPTVFLDMDKRKKWAMATAAVMFVALVVLIEKPETKPAPRESAPSPSVPIREPPPSDVGLVMAPKPSAVRRIRRDCPDARKIVLIGDSYGEGIGPHLRRQMMACGIEYSFDARRGTSATQWVREDWIEPVLKGNPDVVIISLGGNDFLRQDIDTVREAIDGIAARVRGSGARLLWVEPLSLPYPDRIGVRGMWRRVAGNDWFRSEHLYYRRASDRVHISYDNYRDWARRIWPWLVRRTQEAGGPEDPVKPCSQDLTRSGAVR